RPACPPQPWTRRTRGPEPQCQTARSPSSPRSHESRPPSSRFCSPRDGWLRFGRRNASSANEALASLETTARPARIARRTWTGRSERPTRLRGLVVGNVAGRGCGTPASRRTTSNVAIFAPTAREVERALQERRRGEALQSRRLYDCNDRRRLHRAAQRE